MLMKRCVEKSICSITQVEIKCCKGEGEWSKRKYIWSRGPRIRKGFLHTVFRPVLYGWVKLEGVKMRLSLG
jgi:hypothetical protein